MNSSYQIVGELIGVELGLAPIKIAPGIDLTDIPGFDSVALAGVLLAIEQRTGREADRDAIDRVRNVDDLVAILDAEIRPSES
jgi:acyl carrier protein